MAEKEREKKFGKKQNPKGRTGNQNQAFGLGIAETKVYQWAEEYYALEDEVKEAKEQAKERKKRINALKRKEERGKNAESPKKAASDASKKTKEPAEQAAGKNQAAEQKQTAEQKEIPDTLAKEEEHAGEPEADLEVRQITVFDLLAGSDATSKGGKE